MSNTKVVMSQASNQYVAPTFIEDVFSTYLYTGNGSTQTITNGIDLAGEGGLIWTKWRSITNDHVWVDTERGALKVIKSNSAASEVTNGNNAPSSFLSNGFTYTDNGSGFPIASWTFRKAPRFFDVVTWTGTGSTRTVNHNLGVAPGCIFVKRTDTTGDWQVYHRSNTAAPQTDYLVLNSTAATVDSNTRWNDTLPTDSVFTVGTEATVNASGGTYVAYLFAHDPLGPSGDGSDGLIACGSYTGNGSTDGPEIDLGWEPQWVMIKSSSLSPSYWVMADNMRGMSETSDKWIYANLSNAEGVAGTYITSKATGLKINGTGSYVNASGQTYIYIAIRRGPMRAPESGTEVFSAGYGTGTVPGFSSGFPVDFAIFRNNIASSGPEPLATARLTQERYLSTADQLAELSGPNFKFDKMDGWAVSYASSAFSWMFRRAPGFFDVAAYAGNGTAGRTVPHNLGVTPVMMIVRVRNANGTWFVYSSFTGSQYLSLNNTNAAVGSGTWTTPTPSVFTAFPGINDVNETYIAYLFATLPGVSKVGSYTGNGSSQTIDCGFTSGARFILIKRTDSTGDWYVWDTARGIVTGNDPHLSLNTTAAEVTTDDSVDPDSSGFIVNQVAATNINVSAASYIFYAIA